MKIGYKVYAVFPLIRGYNVELVQFIKIIGWIVITLALLSPIFDKAEKYVNSGGDARERSERFFKSKMLIYFSYAVILIFVAILLFK